MGLELKDWLALGISTVALLVAAVSFYFANIHTPAKATLTLLGRSGTPEEISITRSPENIYQERRKTVSVAKTNLSYSLSNTGKQALCVKSVEVLRGPSRLGNLRDSRGFMVLRSAVVHSFVLDPGDIKVIDVTFDNEGNTVDMAADRYRLFSVEIVAADGARFQICHDITNVMEVVSLHDRLWDGCSLGEPVRSDWHI